MPDTIISLEQKLTAARKAQMADNTTPRTNPNLTPEVRYQSDIVIDLTTPDGNIFYILGLCNRLCQKYGLSPTEIAEFKSATIPCAGKTYNQLLDHCHHWFGLIYLNRS
jgi:hypothetical protein